MEKEGHGRARPPNQFDVARLAGVSQSAVSSVLRGDGDKIGLAEATQERIREAAQKLHYLPNAHARALRGRRHYNIGLLVMLEEHIDAFPGAYMLGLYSTAMQAGYRITLVRAERAGQSHTPEWFDTVFDSNRIDVLVAAEFLILPESFVEAGDASARAIVYLNRRRERCAVYVDDYAGARMLTRHFIEGGITDVAFLRKPPDRGAPPHHSIQERLEGYEDEMRAHGLKPRAKNLQRSSEGKSVHQQLIDWLGQSERPKGVFCYDSLLAANLQIAAIALGLRLPEDLYMAGCNQESICDSVPTPLTTLRLPHLEMGAAAARMAIELAESGVDSPCPSIALPPELLPRASTGHPGTP